MSRPAARWSSRRASASAYTVGSMCWCRVSLTIWETSATSPPLTIHERNTRRRSVWSASAPPTARSVSGDVKYAMPEKTLDAK